jgi:hypothetical protein
MAAKSNASDTSKKARKARTTQPQSFVAVFHGESVPTLIIAKTQKSALDAAVTLRAATAQDLLQAGRENWAVIDTTAEKPAEAPAPLAFGSAASVAA